MRLFALATLACLVFVSQTVAQDAPRVRRDVAYAEAGSATSLDVYAPADGSELPIMPGARRSGNAQRPEPHTPAVQRQIDGS